ncbi:hypothetical protein V8G54_030485, partial [Vigna mungo]
MLLMLFSFTIISEACNSSMANSNRSLQSSRAILTVEFPLLFSILRVSLRLKPLMTSSMAFVTTVFTYAVGSEVLTELKVSEQNFLSSVFAHTACTALVWVVNFPVVSPVVAGSSSLPVDTKATTPRATPTTRMRETAETIVAFFSIFFSFFFFFPAVYG